MSHVELDRIRYRSRAGYPGSKGQAWKFHTAKADVAMLLAEVENLQRFVGGLLAPPVDSLLQSAQGGTDDKRSTGPSDGAGDTHRAADRTAR